MLKLITFGVKRGVYAKFLHPTDTCTYIPAFFVFIAECGSLEEVLELTGRIEFIVKVLVGF